MQISSSHAVGKKIHVASLTIPIQIILTFMSQALLNHTLHLCSFSLCSSTVIQVVSSAIPLLYCTCRRISTSGNV